MLNISCGKTKNLGTTSCAYTPGLSITGYLAPLSNRIITKADMADADTLKAFINAQLHHNDPLKRWQALHPYRGFEDMSEDITTFTDEYGDKEVTDDVRVVHAFRHKKGQCYHTYLRTFNNQHEKYVYFNVDNKHVLQGTVDAELDEDGNPQMTGYSLNLLYAPGKKFADRSNPAFFKLMLGFADTKEIEDEPFAVDMGFNPLKLRGVTEVVLKDVTPSGAASGVYHVQPLAGCGQVNLAKLLGSVLADAGAWISNAKDDGNEITIDTVTLNAAGDAYIVTLDTDDTDYDVTDKININLEPVSDLETLGAKWYANTDPLQVVAA